jgi:hypothetical protein
MGRAALAHVGLVAWILCGTAGAEPGQAPDRSGKGLYQLQAAGRGYAVSIRETERGPSHSHIQIEIIGEPTFAVSAVTLFKTVHDIGRERGFEYAFTAQRAELPAPPPNDARQIAHVTVFMTNNRQTQLQALLGPAYSPEAQRQFDREGWMSVARFGLMLGEGANRGGAVSDPLSDLIGVYSRSADGEPDYRISKKGADFFVENRAADGWSAPLRLVAMTEAERREAASEGLTISAGLRMDQGSADQGFDILRLEEPIPGSGRMLTLYVLFSWFGPDMLYKMR